MVVGHGLQLLLSVPCLPDTILFALRLWIPWQHTTAAILEWVFTYFIVLLPLTYHSELRKGRGPPVGAEEEARLLEAE